MANLTSTSNMRRRERETETEPDAQRTFNQSFCLASVVVLVTWWVWYTCGDCRLGSRLRSKASRLPGARRTAKPFKATNRAIACYSIIAKFNIVVELKIHYLFLVI
jgi:hypothetical protein